MLYRWGWTLFHATSGTKLSKRPRGIALPLVMLILLMVIGFTVASGLLTSQNYTNAAGRERGLQAQHAFRAGVATALERLTKDESWNPTEASPYESFLDQNQTVGFRVWLEGINRNSDAPVTTSTGRILARGQAAIRVTPLVNGQEVAGGFAGAGTTPILMRPPARFEQNILHSSENSSLVLMEQSKYYSYHSDGAVAPATSGFPDYSGSGSPPGENKNAVIRSTGTLRANAGVVVYGHVAYPDADKLDFIRHTSAVVVGGRQSFDGMPAPMIFTPPEEADESATTAFVNENENVTLSPGLYGGLVVMEGGTLTLQRGGTYTFLGVEGVLELRTGAKLKLSGPADQSCVIYTNRLSFWGGNVVNMPAAGANPPRPVELQTYLVPWKWGIDSSPRAPFLRLGVGSQVAAVIGGHDAASWVEPGVKLFGAFYGDMRESGNLESHFDEALLGEVLEGKTEWVVVNQGG